MNENIPTGKKQAMMLQNAHTIRTDVDRITEEVRRTITGRKLSPIEELHKVEATVLSMTESPLQVELLDTLIARYGEALYATAGVPYPHGGDDAE